MIDALVVIAVLFQARQGVRLVVLPLVDLAVRVGIEALHRLLCVYHQAQRKQPDDRQHNTHD